MSCLEANESGIEKYYVSDVDPLRIINTHYGLGYTMYFKNDEASNERHKKQLDAIRKSMAEACLWFLPDNTGKNGWCGKCNCTLDKCKTYQKRAEKVGETP